MKEPEIYDEWLAGIGFRDLAKKYHLPPPEIENIIWEMSLAAQGFRRPFGYTPRPRGRFKE